MMLIRVAFVFVLVLCSCKVRQPIPQNSNAVSSKAFIQSFHDGIRLKIQGNYLEALDRFQKCLSYSPSDDATHFALAQTYLLVGDLKMAEKHTVSAVQSDQTNLFYQVELAYMLREKAEYNSAAEIFEILIEAKPRNIEYYFSAMDCYRKANSYSKAISVIEKLERAKGETLETTLQKHQLYLEMGKMKEAEKVLLALHEKTPSSPIILASLVDFYFKNGEEEKAFIRLKELVAEDPQNGMGLLMLAEQSYREGRQDETANYFYKAIQSENISASETINAFDYLVYKKETLKITKSAATMQRLFSSNDTILSSLGDYFFQLDAANVQTELKNGESRAKALDFYNRAVELNPSRYDVWEKLLYFYYDNQKWERLKKASESTVRLFPLKSEPYYLGAVALNQLKENQEAISFAQQGLMTIIDDRVLQSDLLGQLGEAYFGLEDLEMGLKKYLEAISLNEKATKSYLSFNLVLRLYDKRHKLNKALELIEAALLTLTEKDYMFLLLQTDVLFELKEFGKAMSILNTIQSDEKRIVIGVLERKGDLYFKQSNNTEALNYWKQCKEAGGDSKKLFEKIKTGVYAE
ncbi:MAG: CDC27 family protein [Crocinitomicaceae bacterium]